MLLANGVDANRVVLIGGPPIRIASIDLIPGTTVLYGENGAGKTTVLNGVASALTGVRREDGIARLEVRLVRTYSGFDSRLFAQVAKLVRSVVVANDPLRSATDSGPAASAWSEAIDDLIFYEDYAEGEAAHGIVFAQLEKDLSCLTAPEGRSVDTGNIGLALEAVGTSEEPAWEVFLIGDRIDAELAPAERREAQHLGERVLRLFDILGEQLVEILNSASVSLTDLYMGRIDARHAFSCLTERSEIDVDRLTSEALITSTKDRGEADPNLIDYVDEAGFVASEGLARSTQRVSTTASSWLEALTGWKSPLEFVLSHPNRWPTDGLGRWYACESGQRVPLKRLGSARGRWATMAVQLASQARPGSDLHVVIIDEPENALHPAAQRDLRDGFTFRPEVAGEQDLEVAGSEIACAFLATHSPAILGIPHAHIIRVGRDQSMCVELSRIADIEALDGELSAVGMERADLLTMTRSFVLVEGQHDKAVLEVVFGSELASLRARLYVMGGAKRTDSVVNAEFLTSYTDARLVIVIDRAGQEATDLWNEATTAVAAGDDMAAQRALHRIERLPGGETGWVADAGLSALKAGHLERITLVGLERWDIIEYLPVEHFVRGAATWSDLRAEHQRSGRSLDLKEWLRKEKGARVTTDTIRAAAETLDDLADLPQILDALS